MAQIRLLTELERPLAEALWISCFGDSLSFTSWYFRRRAGDVLATLDEGNLIAQMVCVPMTIAVRNKATQAMMLSGIATAQPYRRQGHMSSLTRELFSLLREKGCGVALLYPFDYGYYRHFGFAGCGEVARVKASPDALPDSRMAGQIDSFLCADASQENLSALVRAYQASFGHYTGHALRDEAVFANRLEELALDHGYAAVYSRNGAQEGYLLYQIENKTLCVCEFGASSQQAREALLGFLKEHSATIDQVEFFCALDDPLWRLLPDPRGLVSAEPFAMLRIVDIAAALGGLPAGEGEVTLRISDAFAPWNEGLWRFSGRDGVLVTEKLIEGEGLPGSSQLSALDTVPTLSIEELVPWVFGYRSGSRLSGADMPLGEETAKALDRLLPAQPFFICEMY